MVGKPISSSEFAKVLAEQAEKDRLVKQVEAELRAIKPGECLLYEYKPEAPLWARVGLGLLVDKVRGLKMVYVDNGTYVYREK